MSDQSYEQLWKRVQLHAPDCPMGLAQEFINTAYSRASAWWNWSQLRREAGFYFPAVESTGLVNVTTGSTTIQGVGTAFTAAMLYRQILVGIIAPFYTITAVDVGAQTLTIDRGYEGVTASNLTYQLGQFYQELPSDFREFDTIVDLSNNWRLWTNFTQGQLDVWDAKRQVSGTPWIVVGAPPRITPAGLEVQRVEFWPRVGTTEKGYSFRYWRRPPLMTAPTDRPFHPLRGDVLRKGALAELSKWPGTKTLKNPFYNQDQARMLEKDFQDGLQEVWKLDQSISQTAIRFDDWEGVPYAPIDARYLQTHDIF